MLRFLVLTVIIVAAAIAAPSLDDRIIGGSDASLGEYPYIVSLRKGMSHNCGGSILNEKYILTAAHCVYLNSPEVFQIQYGVVDITGNENIIDVKSITVHEDFNSQQDKGDVAVLELKDKMIFSANAQPVSLPESDDDPGYNATAILVGWGYTTAYAVAADHLQKVEIILFTDKFCEAAESQYNPETHVCAGIPEGGKGQCNGDSGGPLTVNGTQYGIVSWSIKPCSSRGHPGVFAKVTKYREWIRQHSGV